MITFNRRHHILRDVSVLAPNRVRGFTLVEMMVTVGILALVLASLIPTFLVFSKGMAALGNYSSMSMSSRNALEHFSRDIHAASSLITATANEIEIELPEDLGGYLVNYKYDSATGRFTRKKYDGTTLLKTDVLFEDVEIFSMVFYNRLNADISSNSEASIKDETKSIQINAKLVQKVINQNTTDYIISARFLMRNV